MYNIYNMGKLCITKLTKRTHKYILKKKQVMINLFSNRTAENTPFIFTM